LEEEGQQNVASFFFAMSGLGAPAFFSLNITNQQSMKKYMY
jgi:hypothetical protein